MSSRKLGALLTAPISEVALTLSEWDELVEISVRERVAPALAHALEGSADVPSRARETLARERYQTSARNLLLYRELARLLDATTMRAVVLKGGALASTVYDDIALRPMSDLDLLVRSDEVEAWEETLASLGYEPDSPEMAPGLARTVHYQRAFRGGPGNDVVIELHWNLVAGGSDWRSPDVEWFWRATAIWPGIKDLRCPPALQLAPGANILYLSAHAMLQHGGARTRLVWLYDIHLVIERASDEIAWSDVVEQARTLRWGSAVARALAACQEYFGTNLPGSVLAELSAGVSDPAKAHVLAKASVESSRAEHLWRELHCLDTGGRLRLVRAILLPAPAYVKWRYPGAGVLWPLAYAYRWVVVAREGAAYAARVLTTALSFVFL